MSQPNLEPSWLKLLGDEFQKPYMGELKQKLITDKKQFRVYPPGPEMFSAFWLTPFEKVRVVILGQDPYHGHGQAHGLCFSVKSGVEPPPSLVNIYKEIKSDLNLDPPSHGCLSSWAKQGVFLLNTTLSVREKSPKSHFGIGWEKFTDRVLKLLSQHGSHLVFLLWGKPAQAKADLIDANKHMVLKAPHPSPFSAHYGFFGCRHFSKTNTYLKDHEFDEIDWALPASPEI